MSWHLDSRLSPRQSFIGTFTVPITSNHGTLLWARQGLFPFAVSPGFYWAWAQPNKHNWQGHMQIHLHSLRNQSLGHGLPTKEKWKFQLLSWVQWATSFTFRHWILFNHFKLQRKYFQRSLLTRLHVKSQSISLLFSKQFLCSLYCQCGLLLASREVLFFFSEKEV